MDIEKEKRDESGKALPVDGGVQNHPKALTQDADLSEHEDHAEEVHLDEDDHKHIDYSNHSKAELLQIVKDAAKENDFKKFERILKDLKPAYDEMREKERQSALQKFINNGGVQEDFEFKGDETDVAIDANIRLIRDKRAQHLRQEEEKKTDNLRKKTDLIEKIRVLVDSPESANQFEAFKELQREWKQIGPVPNAQAKTLWANYHALVDRFYDNQSIYFELKELDRRKNLEAKLELCARAERLVDLEMIKDAIRELNELHQEFKHVGPVPIEEKEQVWNRFKAASDAVYAKRDAYLATLQQELGKNMELKAKLGDDVQAFASFTSDRIKEWNDKTKEILDIQKRWETIGGLPRSKAKDVNKKFWAAFKQFFNNKNAFFKKLDDERDQNLKLKTELVERALALRESNDWEKTSNELKVLQQKWKDIGPVPEKHRERIFKEFKEACDHFFAQRRGQHDKEEQEQIGNLQLKAALCSEIESHAANGTATTGLLKELQDKYNQIGFVPRKDVAAIKSRFHEAVEKFVNAIPSMTEDQKGRLVLESELHDLKNDPNADRKLFQKEQNIRKKITKVENDIALWKNNLEFFGKSKNADSVRDEFNEKIKTANEHLKELKQQLKLLRTV